MTKHFYACARKEDGYPLGYVRGNNIKEARKEAAEKWPDQGELIVERWDGIL